jgi:hypothetical protein
MEINNVSTIRFTGLWEPVVKMSKESGTFNKDKVMFTLYNATYHPYTGESKETIQNAVNKHFTGRSFCLWDKFDGQNKAEMFQMNFVKVGDSIDKEEARKYIQNGYKEDFTEGVLDDNSFWEAYSNNTYEPYDVSKLSQESILDIADRHFDVKG